jgi:3'-phosphoadenosine 5'-phosphosulfate sulfotransferase (PAPS reductase)/FAD synthetase
MASLKGITAILVAPPSEPAPAPSKRCRLKTATTDAGDPVMPDLASYDFVIVAFSGGKDSLACLLHLLDLGVPRAKIELWHYDVDGREGSNLFDWPCTRDYCRKFAAAFGVPIRFGWKVGGIEGEMNRDDAPTKPTRFETPEGAIVEIGGDGPPGTRLKYPQPAADLTVRWCSAYAKIDIASKMVTNQDRFLGKRTLIVTGERAQESANRAKYEPFEPDRADRREGKRARRHVDHWLPVHGWSEHDVWNLIEKHRVNPHPAYRLGWSRVSCAACIFGDEHQWASLRWVNPRQFKQHEAYEARFGRSIKRPVHRKRDNRHLTVLASWADVGTPYEMETADIGAAMSHTFDEPIIVETWTLPRGAYGHSCGPT